MIGRTGCHRTEEQLVQVLLGTAAVAECLEVERHVRGCARCARTLRGLELAASAYDRAFATLRARLAVVGSLTVELSCAIAPLPSRAILQAPAAAAPQPEDPEGIRAARLKDAEVGDMVLTITAGSPY